MADILSTRTDEALPLCLIQYIRRTKAPKALAIIDALWAKNPLKWEEEYSAFGRAGESRLIFHLKNSPVALKKSAVEILRKVGSSKSLSPLRAARGNGDPDFDISLNRAIDAINNR